MIIVDAMTQLDMDLLTVLHRAGPHFSSDLAWRFNMPIRNVSARLMWLRRQGLVEQEERRYNKRGHTKMLWQLAPGVDLAHIKAPLKSEVGITAEDLVWQAYWRQPRAVRKLTASPRWRDSNA